MLSEQLKQNLIEELKKYDTYLTDNVVKWLEALQQEGHGITIEQIVMVCRYNNWLETMDTIGGDDDDE